SKTFVEYSLGQSDNVLVHPLPAFGSDAQGRDQRASVSYTRTLSSSLIMSFDVRFSRNADVRESQNAGREGLLSSLGIGDLEASVPEDEGYPEFQLSGYSGFGDRISTSGSVRNSYSADGSLTYVMQDHRFGLGLDWDIHQINDDRTGELRRGRFGFNGYYTGDAFADFLLGLPDTAYRAVGTDRTDLRRRSWRVWARDNWRINPQLSANFGLTYDFTPPYHSTRENVSTFYPLLFEPPADGEIVLVGSDRARQLGLDAGDHGLIFPDLNNWAPQLGLAYSPWGSPRSVIRASYSIDYVRPGSGYFIDYLTRNYPFYFIESAQAPPDDPTLDLSSPFQSPAAAELT
ncbi:MAG: TonB-dependent receptor domain-containing protein, partial [bacterium]